MTIQCPACYNRLRNTYIGTLGTLDHWRCRDCGMDFSTSVDEPEWEESWEESDDSD